MRKQPKWTVDEDELRLVCEQLELVHPVVVLPVDAMYTGKYHGLGYWGPGSNGQPYPEPTHVVTLDGSMWPTGASRVALHELTHAAQAERYDTGVDDEEWNVPSWKLGLQTFTTLYDRESSRTNGYTGFYPNASYTGISFEKECNDSMGELDKEFGFQICKPALGVARERYRIDHVKNGAAQTFYVWAYSADQAKEWAKGLEDHGVKRWDDIRVYPARPMPGQEATRA